MTRTLSIFVATLVIVSAIALPVTGVAMFLLNGWPLGIRPDIGLLPNGPPQTSVVLGVAFWIFATLFASAMPVRMPRGTVVSVSMAPIVAATYLGGPFAGGLVAALGTTEMRS